MSGDDLLALPGCTEWRVFEKASTEFENHTIFDSRKLLQKYLDRHASRLRQKAKEKFADGGLQFQRDEMLLVAEGSSQ